MKTVKQIIEKHYKLDTDEEGNAVMYLGQIEDLLLEYGKQLLIEAADKGYALIKDHDGYTREYVTGDYSTEIDMSENSPLKYGCSVIFEKDSILNIINELK